MITDRPPTPSPGAEPGCPVCFFGDLVQPDLPRWCTSDLLALAGQELIKREQNRIEELVKEAHFPMLKELVDFDFSSLPEVNKVRVIDQSRGEYIRKRE